VRLTGVVRDPGGYLYGFMCRLPDCAFLPPEYNRKLGDTGRFKCPLTPRVRVVVRWNNPSVIGGRVLDARVVQRALG
jgi:hypothetical protein